MGHARSSGNSFLWTHHDLFLTVIQNFLQTRKRNMPVFQSVKETSTESLGHIMTCSPA